ncbi:2-succinyl-6-hydroxy-2,4-cyclohexadiene-1-carboxylate synthase [Shewanella sp. UCD-KL12]|uniref:2-succinyl-6-hydroxy-2, 4-cyclohexadiene-1-carboxylate synthase n=1 Tax=Shewanella sp. UCD-KL12 TaxID=1917163 RepID=UPI000970E4B5|nr:2-succinyl-6-hydroxy-2,4-cyclohexadiene-1-carboxylate synthase [Shewanella sp. UCD-KL12]
MLSLSTHGDCNNPTLVMLHGFLGNKEDWQQLLPELTQTFYCVCVDLPGHGDSPILSLNTPGFAQVANAIQQTLLQLDIEYYHLLGYSLGGRISLHMAELFPQHLLSLNIESAHPGLISSKDKDIRIKNDSKWNDKLASQSIEVFLTKWYQQGVFAELSASARQSLIDKRSNNDPQALQSIYLPTSLAVQGELWQVPNQLSAPCHYYVGNDDSKFLNVALKWQTQSSIKVHQFNHAGHNVHLAAPREFCHQLIKQLTENAK